MRPVRPDQGLVLALRRARHNLDLHHLARALAQSGADAVRAGVPAANHHHPPPMRGKLRRDVGPVLLRVIVAAQIVHRLMHMHKVAPGAVEVAGLLAAAG